MTDDVCECCGGEQIIWRDTVDSRNEHTTVEEPCPICVGESETDDTDDIADWWEP